MGEDKEEEVVISPPKPVKKAAPKIKPRRKPSSINADVTVIIVNFKTKILLKKAFTTFRAVYPKVRIIIVDNGSGDSSTEFVKHLGKRSNTTAIMLPRNAGHGPAMHHAIQKVDTPYTFLLDTDTEVLKAGFLEAMVSRMKEEKQLYAIGWRRYVDRVSGVPLEWHTQKPPPKKFVAYIHPSAALIRTSIYHTLVPFFYHGAPCLDNMKEADKRGFKVESFPIRKYVKHLKAGTRRMYRGRWDPTEKTPRIKWDPKKEYPI